MNRINNSQTKHKQNFNRKVVVFLKKLCCLPPVPTFLIAVPSFALVFRVLAVGVEHGVIANAAYVLSAYALIISVTGAVRIGKWLRGGLPDHPVVQQVLNHPYAGRYLKESMFRAEVSLYPGLLINLFYAGIKLFSGIRYHSVWFGTLSAYYLLLAVMRFSLLHQVRKKVREGSDERSELRRCRLCGMILLILNWALTGMIILVVKKNSGFTYPGMLIYAMALYAFYAVITAVRNVVKFRKCGSPVLSAAKVINLTAALVSMFSLETAMLTQFGGTRDSMFRQRMTAATGAGVSILILGMAVSMIVQTTGRLRAGKKEVPSCREP